jgi:hypothetical protein
MMVCLAALLACLLACFLIDGRSMDDGERTTRH